MSKIQVLLVSLSGNILLICSGRLTLKLERLHLGRLLPTLNILHPHTLLKPPELLLIPFLLLTLVRKLIPEALDVASVLGGLVRFDRNVKA